MVKRLPIMWVDPGSIPGLGRSPAEGNGNPLLYSCLENSMDGGAWQATVHGVTKSQTQLSDFTFHFGPSAIRDEPLFCHHVSDSSTLNLANPHFLEMWTFHQPGNLNLALQRASVGCSLFCSLVWMDFMTWPLWTLATVPWAFAKASQIPICSLD